MRIRGLFSNLEVLEVSAYVGSVKIVTNTLFAVFGASSVESKMTSMATNSKKRFSEEEKEYLLLMIERYKNIIENKETDGASLHQKRKAWLEIVAKFNRETDHTERTVSQLQKCWDNIKTKRKKELAASKRARFCTGGGPIKIMDGDKDEAIDAIIMNATDIELKDSVDSDAVTLSAESGEIVYEGGLQIINEVVVPLQPEVDLQCTDNYEPVVEMLECTSNDFNVSTEENLIPARKKRKMLTARQGAINLELEARLKKMANISNGERELHAIRKQEVEARLQTALEDLNAAKIRTEVEQSRLNFEKKLQEIKLAHIREKHELEMKNLGVNK